MTRTFCTGLMCALVCVSAPPARAQSAPPAVPLFDNLGTHHYDITPSVPLTQRYFDQGLRLYYGFNHAEAIRAFQEAARRDPDCAMCYWGIALALGPNINAPMERDAALAAYEAIQKALAREQAASPKERALIRALAARYAADPPQDQRVGWDRVCWNVDDDTGQSDLQKTSGGFLLNTSRRGA